MQVVQNALTVLEEVARRQPVSLAELQQVIGLPKTTIHRALSSLRDAGWARAASDRRWLLAPRAAVLGARAANAGDIREIALPVMMALRDDTGEAVHLTVPDADAVVLIERVECPHAVRTHNAIGARAPLYASAHGKVVLAHAPEPEAEERIAEARTAFTERTMTDPDSLRKELRRIRKRGWATNRGEWVPEVASVAAPVFSRGGQVVAAIGISAPESRLPKSAMAAAARCILLAATELSAHLGHPEAADRMHLDRIA